MINLKTVIIGISALLIAATSCNRNPGIEDHKSDDLQITVFGTIENGEDQLVTLDKMGANAFIPIDSVRCDEEGKFKITFENPIADFYSVKYSRNGYITLIAKPGDIIKIGGTTESLHPYTIEGSDDSQLVHKLSLAHRDVLSKLQEIADLSHKIMGDADYSKKKLNLNRKYDSVTLDFQNYSTDFIKKNSTSLSILFALHNQYGPGLPVYKLPEDMEIYEFVDSCLYKLHTDNEAVKSLHIQLSTVKEKLRLQQKKSVLSPGMLAPDFVMQTYKGSQLSLSDLKGSYVLIQFWASWSKPSMEENIFLKNCYNTFHKGNFTILQVSIDNDKTSWINAIEDLGVEWNHVSDLNRWESKAVDLYNVDRIPANFLLNPKGVIVEKDIFGEDLAQTIAKYLK